MIAPVARVANVLVLSLAAAAPAQAARVCDLPATLALAAEERPLLDGGGGGLIVGGAPAPGSGLRVGDVVRQANGRRIAVCADLEAVAAEALARGLLVLVAAERDGALVTAALGAPEAASASAEAASAPPPASAPDAGGGRAAPSARAPMATPRATPPPAPEAELPARGEASPELAAKAVAAAALLGTVDEAARLAVPLAAYERRLTEASNALAALSIEGEGGAAVRGAIAEAVGYHETARDIRRYKAAELAHARVDHRGAGALSLPYFSDSEVPRWMERYPFLGESLQHAPRTTHMLLPGEMAGRWNPDQAVELLWERARRAAARLAAWGGGR
ncbi:MAG: hypothetical protein IT294_18395 [Deltaproteobacteria bacterium]|nr:hypothetical protein [Deltaproteobacteria bacterium]